MITEQDFININPIKPFLDDSDVKFMIINTSLSNIIKELNTIYGDEIGTDINSDVRLTNYIPTEHAIRFSLSGDDFGAGVCDEIIELSINLGTNCYVAKKSSKDAYGYIESYGHFASADKNGNDLENFTMEWADNNPCYHEDTEKWDAFIKVTDNDTNEFFYIGEKDTTKEMVNYYVNEINSH